MGLFDKLFGKNDIEKSAISGPEPEHAVIIQFNYGIEGLEELHKLEEKLENIIVANKVGEYDGHEIATDYSDGILYMYGPNAEILFKAIKSTLDETAFLKGAIAKLRFGPPADGVKEIEVEL
ncbi:MAG: hypothetical protein SGI83_02860 [Bacteroidota bacterium]|nr:hypothetical protein [Bacteroidota bacterium]